MKTATKIRDLPRTRAGASQVLWRLDPPLTGYGSSKIQHEYVVTSAVNAMHSGPETYIFPADKSGKVTSWGELEGSYRGDYDHERAIEGAGYSVKESA